MSRMASSSHKFDDPVALCKQFVERHNILMTGIVQRELLAIYWTIRAKLEIDAELRVHSSKLLDEAEPTWGLICSMLDRAFEHTEACIIAFIAGSPAASEVIARTVVESTLNVMYILTGDRNKHLAQYFSHYFINEQDEIDKWLKLASSMKGDAAQAHRSAALGKREALDKQEKLIAPFFKELGLPAVRQIGWPNKIIDKFRSLGLEADYRTVYAAMCSQTHNDAEDLLNYCIFISMGNQDLINKMAAETINFSRLLMYFGILYYLEAMRNYAKCFGLIDAATNIETGSRAIYKQLVEIEQEIGFV